MANRVTQSPMIIDTPGATIFYPHGIKIRHMEWQGYLAGATAIVQDGLGGNIWAPTAASDLSEVRTAAVGWIDTGIAITTLSSGKITVFFD